MKHTRLPTKIWFWAMFIMATDKRGSSATYLSTALKTRYKSAWLLLQKLRSAMRNRDARYLLEGIVEFDDSYFGGPAKGGKRGRGTDKARGLAALSKKEGGASPRAKSVITTGRFSMLTKKCSSGCTRSFPTRSPSSGASSTDLTNFICNVISMNFVGASTAVTVQTASSLICCALLPTHRRKPMRT
jgi:hypothetical protein